MADESATKDRRHSTDSPARVALEGVVIGVLVGFSDDAMPLVAFPGNSRPDGVPARSTAALQPSDIGREVALMFEAGDPERPLVMGRLLRFQEQAELPVNPQQTPGGLSANVDGERIEFRAESEIVLRCGRASITLTRAGKILIKGAYLLSRSSGVNRIKGASVQVN